MIMEEADEYFANVDRSVDPSLYIPAPLQPVPFFFSLLSLLPFVDVAIAGLSSVEPTLATTFAEKDTARSAR